MSDPAVPTFQRCVWWVQWFAIPVLPVWLLVGTGWIAGDGWVSLFLMILFCPALLVLLCAAPLLSLRIRRRNNRATHLFAVASVVTWALVIVTPFFIQQAVDSVVQPLSFAMRVGLPGVLTTPITIVISIAIFAGIVLSWVAAFFARKNATELPPITSGGFVGESSENGRKTRINAGSSGR